MTRRLARAFAAAGWLVAVVAAVGAVALRVADPVPVVPNNLGFTDAAFVSFEFLGLAFASVGSLLVLRRPANAVGWVMVLIGVSHALTGVTGAVLASAVADGPAGAATAGVAAWLTTLFASTAILIFGLPLIFPTGRGQTPAWDRFIVVLAIGVTVVYGWLLLVQPGPLIMFPSITNPAGFGPNIRAALGAQEPALIASASIVVPVLAWSMVSRYRMSDAVGRQQIKWFMLAASAAVGAFSVTAIATALTGEAPEAGLVVFGFAGALVPVAIGIAILRYRLYDIDRIISRTLAYATITGVLAAVFTGVILVVGGLLTALAQGVVPSERDRTIAVAVSTLVVFALFQPVRRGVQRAVDRRFDRARYDADRTVDAFTARLRYDADLAAVSREIVVTRPSRSGPPARSSGCGGRGR